MRSFTGVIPKTHFLTFFFNFFFLKSAKGSASHETGVESNKQYSGSHGQSQACIYAGGRALGDCSPEGS